jgi:predicted TIM-barrel fold metal-dependent hydrolase
MVENELIDINCWAGHWPFQRFGIQTADELSHHLRDRGIRLALVSHLGAVFYADTDAYNRDLFELCAGSETLLPVPIVNPAIRGWRRNLEAYEKTIDLRAVRLMPSFHNYELFSEPVFELIDFLSDRPVAPLIQLRMQDERNAWHAMDVAAPDVSTIVRLHRSYPEVPFIILSAYLPEARQIGRETDCIGVDISFTDWLFTLEELLSDVPAERVFFGSHTPLLYTGAITRKLLDAQISDAAKASIAFENACVRLHLESC